MATKVGFSVYRFELRPRNAPTPWDFRRNSNTDGYAELDRYLQTRYRRITRLGIPDAEGNFADQRALMITRMTSVEDRRLLAGIVHKGEAGAVREIRDFDNPDADPVYRTRLNDGVLTPLYYRFHIEDGRRYGIAILQTLGIDGVKGYLEADLRRFFSARDLEPLTVRLTQLVDARVLDGLAQRGELQDVVLINSGKTAEAQNAMNNCTVGDETLGRNGDKLALRVHRRDGWAVTTLRQLIGLMRGGGDPRQLVNVEGMGHVDDLLVEIKSGGQKQTFSLVNPDDSPIRYDVSRQINPGPDGMPTWESLHAAADTVWGSVRELIN